MPHNREHLQGRVQEVSWDAEGQADSSTQCGHYYEYDAIIQIITVAARRGGSAKCPQFGCQQVLTKASIQKDPVMQRRAAQFQAREEQRREDEEDLGDQSFIEI